MFSGKQTAQSGQPEPSASEGKSDERGQQTNEIRQPESYVLVENADMQTPNVRQLNPSVLEEKFDDQFDVELDISEPEPEKQMTAVRLPRSSRTVKNYPPNLSFKDINIGMTKRSASEEIFDSENTKVKSTLRSTAIKIFTGNKMLICR